jgi:hypothetical protein
VLKVENVEVEEDENVETVEAMGQRRFTAALKIQVPTASRFGICFALPASRAKARRDQSKRKAARYR